MAWVRLDEGFPDHPKVVTVGPLAGWLHVCALAYCNRYLTDGFVPSGKVPALADFTGLAVVDGMQGRDVDARELVDVLVDVGMWEERRGGYLIHDFLNYQPSRAEIEAQRKVKQEAGRAGGLKSGQSRHGSGKQSTATKQTTKQNPSRPRSRPEAQHQPETQAGAKAKPKPDPVTEEIYPPPPLQSSSTNGTAGVGKSEGEVQNLKPTPTPHPEAPDPPEHPKLRPLAEHLAGHLWPDRPRMLAESVVVVGRCLAVADQAVVDECIGAMIGADDPPRSPKYLLTTVRNRLVGMGAYAAGDEALNVLGDRS